MDVVKVVREAWSVVRSQRSLWVFGLFLASAGSGAGSNSQQASGSSGAVPAWVWALLAAGLVFGAIGLFLHVVSEAAAIEGVVRVRQREAWSVRAGLRAGTRSFRVVASIKLLVGLAWLVALGVVASPWALHLAGALSLPAAIAISVPLALVGAPVALSGYFVYLYALRFAVLEGEGALDSLREGLMFLRGRVKDSIKLLIGQAIASFVMQMVGLVALLPALLVGGLTYVVAGLVPAAIAAAVVAVPLVVVVAGASGALRSSIWTCGFLAARGRL